MTGEDETDKDKDSKRVKHTPGRDHARKSLAQKKIRYQRRAARKNKAKQVELQQQWYTWDNLPSEVQKLRPDLKPKFPRLKDEH